MIDELKELLKQELELFFRGADILNHSYEDCRNIGIKESYNIEELDKLEALTSRFARLSDILIQKVLRLIDKIELEDDGTVRDKINRAEKRGIVENADQLIEIRVLRNNIAHEYMPEELMAIYKKVLEFTPLLLDDCNSVKEYCEKYLK
jgi:uncharacterized protein YutE (UPF0331/DUF86 family)